MIALSQKLLFLPMAAFGSKPVAAYFAKKKNFDKFTGEN